MARWLIGKALVRDHGVARVVHLAAQAGVDTLYRDGIVALPGAFSREWAEQMREDMMTAFWAAIQRPGGAVGRLAQALPAASDAADQGVDLG